MSAALEVIQPGLHTTLQDRGRIGYQRLGVPVCGALDDNSLRLANALVGNPLGTAALEIRLAGPTLRIAAQSVRVALTGTNTELEVRDGADRVSIPAWRSVTLRRDQELRLAGLKDTATAYLAVEGGFDLPEVLGSLSTYTRGGIGGFHGRALESGDRLPLRKNAVEENSDTQLPEAPTIQVPESISVILGPQDDYFTDDGIKRFLNSPYMVSQQADRMGLRLDGPTISHAKGYDIVSDGIAAGAVQVPGSQLPIVLLADRQTTGGYPKIATVASADLGLLSRMRPGDSIRFAEISTASAIKKKREQEEWLLKQIENLRPLAEASTVDVEALYRENLISGIVSSFD